MKRSKYDPPEYRAWRPRADVQAEYAARVTAVAERALVISALHEESLLRLYEGMLRFRLFDTMLMRWVRQGVINKAWLGTGEEAVSVGCAQALLPGDVIGPMIRNAGACFEVGMPMLTHFAGYLGTTESGTGGRDLHVGDLAHGVVAPISHVGSLLPVMCGFALAFKLRGEPRVAMTWVGDGATRTGEVHEALNLAAVQRLPIVVVLQNNQIALGTRNEGESAATLASWAAGYGVRVHDVDGNNVLDVHAAAHAAVGACRAGEGPAVIVAETFRMGGHATHDTAEARRLCSEAEFEHWGARDPIGCFEEWLAASELLEGDVPKRLAAIEDAVEAEVEAAAEAARRGAADAAPDPASVALGVYAGEVG